jgi:hypothetical protein
LVVQAAQEHADHAGVLLGQTRRRADDIRSQVAESRELAEMKAMRQRRETVEHPFGTMKPAWGRHTS